MNIAQQKDRLNGQQFARVSKIMLYDKRLGLRHFKVLSMLVLHANKSGIFWTGLETLAEELGYFDKKGNPDKSMVSKLISWDNSKTGPGPGLVQLGYVKKLGWIEGRDTQSYQILLPKLSAADLNTPTNRKLSSEEYAAKKEAKKAALKAKETADAEAYFSESEAANAEIEDRAKASPKKSAIRLSSDEEYTRDEVRRAYHDGDWGDIPRALIERYGFSYSFAE